MGPYFRYELTSIPTSLFKDRFMRKSQKSQLAKFLQNGVNPSVQNPGAMYVIDGGALLHRVKWQKKVTYKPIVNQYVKYVRTRYGDCCVVFDGYGHGPSITDHLSRTMSISKDEVKHVQIYNFLSLSRPTLTNRPSSLTKATRVSLSHC